MVRRLRRAAALTAVLTLFTQWTVPAHAMSIHSWKADEPGAKTAMATHERSPFMPMYLTSYAGLFISIARFHAKSGSIDDRQGVRNAVGSMGYAAYFGFLALYLGVGTSTAMSNEERAKLGDLSHEPVDEGRLRFRRGMFLFFHGLNTLSVGYTATQSKRTDRWAFFAGQALGPVAVDMIFRHVFKTDDVSPWTFTLVPAEQKEGPLMLTFARSF